MYNLINAKSTVMLKLSFTLSLNPLPLKLAFKQNLRPNFSFNPS